MVLITPFGKIEISNFKFPKHPWWCFGESMYLIVKITGGVYVDDP